MSLNENGETKTSDISTSSLNDKFYGNTFSRPTTLLNLFQDSEQAMKDGIGRNPYAHWKSDSNSQPPLCNHEFSRHKISYCADCKEKVISLQQIAKEEEWKKRIASEDAANSDHISLLHECGVRVDWLLAFTFDHNCWDKPTWWVNRHIIKLATKETRCRYMHLPEMKKYSAPAAVFISHPWGSKWGDVVLAACQGARHDRIVWIDLFAVRQWPGSEADLIFRDVIGKCKALIVSISPVAGLKKTMNTKEDRDIFLLSNQGIAAKKVIPTFRLWCNVEIAAGVGKNIPIIVRSGCATICDLDGSLYKYDTYGQGSLMENLANMVDVEMSEYSVQDDYDREMAIIHCLDGGVNHVNELISGVIIGEIFATFARESSTRSRFEMEIDAYLCGEPEALRELKMSLCSTEEEWMSAQRILILASSGGRVNVVKELIERWTIESKDSSQKVKLLINATPALLVATRGGHITVVKTLLSVEGVDVNSCTDDKQTALYMACLKGFLDIVKVLLLEPAIAVNCRSDDGMTSVFLASQSGFTEIVDLLLQVKEINILLPRTSDGAISLHIACRYGHIGVVKLLLANKTTNVNQKNNRNSTPLYFASFHGHVEIVKLLLQQPNIDVNMDAWEKIHHYNCNQIMDLIADFVANRSIHDAVASENISYIQQWLTQEDVDVNEVDSDGRSCFFIACRAIPRDAEIKEINHTHKKIKENHHEDTQTRFLEIIKLLLTVEGIDINQSDNQGWTPFFVACDSANTHIVDLLLSVKGIDIHKPNTEGATPLMCCCRNSYWCASWEIVEVLLQQPNIDMNRAMDVDKYMNPLLIACDDNRIRIVRLLVEAEGIDINRQNKYGRTPLSIACVQENLEIVRYLLQQPNIDVNIKDYWDNSCLDLAIEHEYLEIAALLEPSIDKKLAERQNEQKNVSSSDEEDFDEDFDEEMKLAMALSLSLTKQNSNTCSTISDSNLTHEEGETKKNVQTDARSEYQQKIDLLKTKTVEGVDVNTTCEGNGIDSIILLDACQQNLLEDVKFLLSQPNIDVNLSDKKGTTALFIASLNGFIEIVKLLLDVDDIDINHPAKENATSLFIASLFGHEDVVRLLLQQPNIDIHTRTVPGDSALDAAKHRGHQNIIQLLRVAKKNERNGPTFCSYCKKPEPESTNKRFNKCERCRYVSYCNRECQIKHWKSKPNGHKKQCKKLAAALEEDGSEDSSCGSNNDNMDSHGEDDDGSDDSDDVETNDMKLAMALSMMQDDSYDVSVNICDNFRKACEEGRTEIVKLFLESKHKDIKNAMMNEEKKQITTPLYLSCQNGHFEVVKYLLDWKVNVTLGWFGKDEIKGKEGIDAFHFRQFNGNDGTTPYYIACKNGHTEIVQMLLDMKMLLSMESTVSSSDSDTDFDTDSEDGAKDDAALYIACEVGKTEIVKLILLHQYANNNVNKKSSAFCFALEIATEKNHLEIIQLLTGTLADAQIISEETKNTDNNDDGEQKDEGDDVLVVDVEDMELAIALSMSMSK